MTVTAEMIESAVSAADFGKATAAKLGRTDGLPYVPVIEYADPSGVRATRQLPGLAYATRSEAIAGAERHIARLRTTLAEDLARPNMRALREHHGLPREINGQVDL